MTPYSAINEKKSLVHTFRTQSFAGVIELDRATGRKKLVIKAEAYFKNQLNKFQVGTAVSVYITDKKPKRTENQNRYYWLYVGMIAAETGNDQDELHELFKGKFLTEKIVYVLGEPVRMKKSTTELSVTDFSEFISKIEVLTGILAPPAE